MIFRFIGEPLTQNARSTVVFSMISLRPDMTEMLRNVYGHKGFFSEKVFVEC